MYEENKLPQLCTQFLNECQYSSRLRLETIRSYREVIQVFIKVMPEITEANLISTEMIIEFFKRLQTRERIVGKGIIKVGVKSSTIKTYHTKFGSFLEWLFKKGIIPENPIKKIKPPELRYEDSRALDEDSVRKLYSSITLNSKDLLILRRDIAMVSLLIFSGIRLGEFVSLEVRNVDFEKRLLTVQGQTSKSQKTRVIPIHPTLLFHLRDYIIERNKRKYQTQYLIVSANRDRDLGRDGVKQWVKKHSANSGVKFHLHQFRHSFACNLAKKNVSAVKIQKLLGHSSLNMTMTYLRSINTEEMQDDINRLSI